MTRAQGEGPEIEYACEGAASAERAVVVLRTGPVATVDPDAHVTREHNVRLVLVHLDGPELDDPPAYGGETPAGSTAAALAAIVAEEIGERTFGLVAERATGALALSVAAGLGPRVDRLALVSVPTPASPLERDVALPVLDRVKAPTLVLARDGDAEADSDAAWHRDHLPDARLELVPVDLVASGDGRLALSDVWARVLTHIAPGSAQG